MKTLPTDFIELTRDQGDALWWACDAWFDHCSLLLKDPCTSIDRALLAASNAAGNALRSSLQTAGVDRTVERIPTTDAAAIRRIITGVMSMDSGFLALDWDENRWPSREKWSQVRQQVQHSLEQLEDILMTIDDIQGEDHDQQ